MRPHKQLRLPLFAFTFRYEEDIYDQNKKAYKSVRQVRAMHQAICKLMNGKTNRVIGKDNIWVSQASALCVGRDRESGSTIERRRIV